MAARSPESLSLSSSHAVTSRTIACIAAGSVLRFLPLPPHRSLRRPPERLGASLLVDDGRTYQVFRETVSDAVPAASPTVLVVGFQLKLVHAFRLPHWVFQRCCLLTTPFWSGLPGFSVKLW